MGYCELGLNINSLLNYAPKTNYFASFSAPMPCALNTMAAEGWILPSFSQSFNYLFSLRNLPEPVPIQSFASTVTTPLITAPIIPPPITTLPGFQSEFNKLPEIKLFSQPSASSRSAVSKKTEVSLSASPTKRKYSSGGSWLYASLGKKDALARARQDSNLEELTGGSGWTISSGSFTNDIPFAKKGTGRILSKVSAMVGQNLTITSALGTGSSPHAKGGGSSSHYNHNNPKLDIGGGLGHREARALREKLLATGYFSRVEVEDHGSTSHLDVQIKEEKFQDFSLLA